MYTKAGLRRKDSFAGLLRYAIILLVWLILLLIALSTLKAFVKPVTATTYALKGDAQWTQRDYTNVRLNINRAIEAELITLNGIGKKTAKAIIAYREAHGVFLTVDDLKGVEGIGESVLEAIRDSICVD